MNTTTELSGLANSQVATRPATPGGAMVAVEQQRVMAEVQAAMLMARANPRDEVAARDRIMNACRRPGLAEAAVYQYSRGGTDITGPSIRLAEAMAQCWGNIKTSMRELETKPESSTVQVICWDLESGYSSDKVFVVQHVRYTKQGVRRLDDPRDVYENLASQAARRLRACILAVIPGDITEDAVKECERTLTMSAKADTSDEAMARMLDAFASFGVSREQIEKRIQRRIDSITPAQVVALRKVHNSLKDGMSMPADWFDMTPPEPNTPGVTTVSAVAEQLKESIRQRQAMKQQKAPPIAEPPAGLFDAPLSLADFKASVDRATSVESAELVLDQARDVLDGLDHADLSEHFRRKWVPR